MYNSDQRKLLSALCHGSVFFSPTLLSVGIPIAILFASDDPVVKENAKESINYHISLFAYAIGCVILMIVVIGFFFLIILGMVSFILSIIAIVRVIDNPDKPYRYPLIFRLV